MILLAKEESIHESIRASSKGAGKLHPAELLGEFVMEQSFDGKHLLLKALRALAACGELQPTVRCVVLVLIKHSNHNNGNQVVLEDEIGQTAAGD